MVKGFSCRVYGVLVEDGRVLLTRSKFLDREFVNFPGGGMDLGEAPVSALKREFVEETGLDVEPVRVLHASEGLHLSTQIPMQIVSMYWLVEKRGGALRATGNGDDVLALFWADVGSVPTDEMFPADREFASRLHRILGAGKF